MKHLSDIDIIDSIKRGNTADFSLLINRYKDRAFSLLKRLLKNEMDAEEALQDSFLKAYNSLNNLIQKYFAINKSNKMKFKNQKNEQIY